MRLNRDRARLWRRDLFRDHVFAAKAANSNNGGMAGCPCLFRVRGQSWRRIGARQQTRAVPLRRSMAGGPCADAERIRSDAAHTCRCVLARCRRAACSPSHRHRRRWGGARSGGASPQGPHPARPLLRDDVRVGDPGRPPGNRSALATGLALRSGDGPRRTGQRASVALPPSHRLIDAW